MRGGNRASTATPRTFTRPDTYKLECAVEICTDANLTGLNEAIVPLPPNNGLARHGMTPLEDLMPGYWMNETSGVLRPAVEAYLLTDEELSPAHVAALRAYFRQWIAAPWSGAGIDELRAGIDGLDSRAAIETWLDKALVAGIDPL